MRYTQLSPVALMMWKALEHRGCDAESIFRAADLDPAKLYDPSNRYDTAKVDRAWVLALEATDDPCFGLSLAEFWHPTSLHALGYAWLASDTLHDALSRLVRYFRMVSDLEELELAFSQAGFFNARVSGRIDDPNVPPTTEDVFLHAFAP